VVVVVVAILLHALFLTNAELQFSLVFFLQAQTAWMSLDTCHYFVDES
jgi:hypothetical protein